MTDVNEELEGDSLRWCPICGSWECDPATHEAIQDHDKLFKKAKQDLNESSGQEV